MKLSGNQKKILDRLIIKYENSKTYVAENKISQRFYIKPTDIIKDYYSDFADLDAVCDFERDVQDLVDNEFVYVDYKKNMNVINKIYLVMDSVEEIRKLIRVREKKEVISDEVSFYNEACKQGEFSEWYSREELERIANGKRSRYSIEETKVMLDLAETILKNEDEILERELSIKFFRDTKKFEKSYRIKICRKLLQYIQETGKEIDEYVIEASSESEKNHLLLETFGIYQNPTYVFLKGKIALKYITKDDIFCDTDSRIDCGVNQIEPDINAPIALSYGIIKKLKSITMPDRRVVTVENLTSFHRIEGRETTYIYTGGYTGRVVKELLKYISRDNPDVEFFHFGDIDPDGFLILENLRNTTGLDIKPLYMDKETLDKYRKYTKKLSDQDITKGENLIKKGLYTNVLKYMLSENIKLEQEVIMN